jgi:hypothetical protein
MPLPPAILTFLDSAEPLESALPKSHPGSTPESLRTAARESAKVASPGDFPTGLKGSSMTSSTAEASLLSGLLVIAIVLFATPSSELASSMFALVSPDTETRQTDLPLAHSGDSRREYGSRASTWGPAR